MLRKIIAAAAIIFSAGCFHGKQTTPLHLFDGFEGDSIADFWLPGNYGSGRFEAGAVKITKQYARTGNGSVCITLNEGDIHQINEADGIHLERAELDSGRHSLLKKEAWVGFSFRIPSGFPRVDNRLVIAQWKQRGVEHPLIAERFRKGRHFLTVGISETVSDDSRRFPLPEIVYDRWNDIIWHAYFSPDRDGRFELWMNGSQCVSFKGSTTSKEGRDSFYHKIGLYRDRWKELMIIFFDSYTIGDSFVEVNPARFDAR